MKNRNPFKIIKSVIFALFLRELDMRLYSGRAGLFWTFFQPFFQVFIFVAIKIILFGKSSNEFDYATFLALNFTAFFMFKNIVIKSITSFKANKALFVYKQVKPINTILARAWLEIFITIIIIAIFITIGLYFNFNIEVKNFFMVFLGFVWLILFSISIGLFLAIVNTFYDSVNKLVGFAMTGLMFGSSVFYTIQSLPQNFQNILLLNPLTHFMEMLHGNFFRELNDSFVDYNYMIMWTVFPLFISLWLYEKLEKRLITQ